MSNTTTKSPLIKKIEAAQADRKAAFFKSGRTPWSREEWRWHNERQEELAALVGNEKAREMREAIANVTRMESEMIHGEAKP